MPVDDAALPRGCPPPPSTAVDRAGVRYRAATWSAEGVADLSNRVRRGAADLAVTSDVDLLAAWEATVAEFLPPDGAAWNAIAPTLATLTGLSTAGLAAGLEVVLRGASGRAARELFGDAVEVERSGGAARDPTSTPPVLIVLSSNLPGLALQPLLSALALRRPVIVKSSSAEPLFTPAFVRALGGRSAAVAAAWGAITWRGGDPLLETPLLDAAARILAYGERETIDSLSTRAPGRVFGFGPKLSIGYASAASEPTAAARGFARDVALFDQRGCLSPQAIYTESDPRPYAEALAAELTSIADTLPPGPIDPGPAARVHALRADADLRGLSRPELPLETGTVVVDPDPRLRPSPGLRTVRLQQSPPGALVATLEPWRDQIQGVAVAGSLPAEVARSLHALGVSRIAPAGTLHDVDTSWHNGGVHPLTALSG